jgi:hypothetical protein
MIDRDEINSSLTGAWKIFLDRPDALQHFDTSYAGFWRSFQAIFLIAPLYAVATLASWRMVIAATPPGQEVLDLELRRRELGPDRVRQSAPLR